MAGPRLRSIQVGPPRTYADDAAGPWTTGFYKQPITGPVWLGRTNLVGDGQADRVNHGGPDKAVCAYPADHFQFWAQELGRPDLPGGAFGENFTVAGLTEPDGCVGDVWTVGGAAVEVSQPRQPCWKLARRWGRKDLALRVIATGRTGWYFRVRAEGWVEAGQPLTLADRPHPAWPVSRANDVMHHRKADRAAAAELAAVPPLAASWRDALLRRVQNGCPASD